MGTSEVTLRSQLTKETISECVDVGLKCVEWKGKGYCDGGEFVNFMSRLCRKTCGKCDKDDGGDDDNDGGNIITFFLAAIRYLCK